MIKINPYDAHPFKSRTLAAQEGIPINTCTVVRLRPVELPKSIRLYYAALHFPKPNIVTVHIDSGYTVDGKMVEEAHQMIYKHLGCDYGMIADRSGDYTLTPVPIFQFFNRWDPLRAIAIVTHRPISKTIAEIDKSLSEKPIKVFEDMETARAWMEAQLANDQNKST